MIDVNDNILNTIKKIREQLAHGENTTNGELKVISDKWRPYRYQLCPNEKDEIFDLVDSKGNSLGLKAERWLCHLFGLRHMCVHVLIRWHAKNLGPILILQVRSWSKSNAPGMLDISVGGHVIEGFSIEKTVFAEMYEELGISNDDLIDNSVIPVCGYESTPEMDSSGYFLNIERREVFIAELISDSFNNIQFKDNEVVGIYLCPEKEAYNLINNGNMPVADALKYSLPKCL